MENSSLDAYEDLIVIIAVENAGKGTGFGVDLSVTPDVPEVSLPTPVLALGDLKPGERREVLVPLRGAAAVRDGQAEVRTVAKERRGFDSNVLKIELPTSRIRAPALALSTYTLEDGATGLARGNGNGIPEPGETVELVVVVENNGEGETVGAKLTGAGGGGIRWVNDTAELGKVLPGDRARARLAFEVPRGFTGKDIPIVLTASEARGVGGAEKAVALDVRSIAPDLRWAQRLVSGGRDVQGVGSGEEVEVELSLENRGELVARDVVFTVAGEGVRLSSSRLEVGEVAPGRRAPVQRVLVSVPRTYAKPEVALDVSLAQADFPGARETLRIQVAVRAPSLRYEVQLVSSRGANLLEHQEMGKLRVRVRNEGALDAEGVRLEIGSPSEHLKLQSAAQREIGRVPAGGASEWLDFVVQALRPLGAGPRSLKLSLTQKEFPGLQEAYALTVVEQEAQVVRVAGDADLPTPRASSRPERAPPAIEVLSPRPGDEVDGETVLLAATVTDAEALESVRVFVRNLRVDLKPGAVVQRSPGRWEVRAEIPVPEGDAEIRVTAVNTEYKTAQAAVPVRRTPEENVDEAPIRPGAKNPTAVAVLIGISRYADPSIPPVEFAGQDAATVKDYLVYTLGYPRERIVELYDEGATLGRLQGVFGERGRLEQLLEPDGSSDVFVYFSGHGVPDQKDWEQYLLPFEASPDRVVLEGYRIEDLYARLSRLKARTLTVVLDACFSGSSERGALVTGTSAAILKVKHPILNFGPNAVALTASTDNQVANWHDAKRHGLFTYYFLSGLRGHADLDGDQTITAAEMEAYLKKHVPAKALQLRGREQTPQVVGDKGAVLARW